MMDNWRYNNEDSVKNSALFEVHVKYQYMVNSCWFQPKNIPVVTNESVTIARSEISLPELQIWMGVLQNMGNRFYMSRLIVARKSFNSYLSTE